VPEPRVARWQDRLDPFWQRLSGGCHLNRKIDDLLALLQNIELMPQTIMF
jgi:hypothetical protein